MNDLNPREKSNKSLKDALNKIQKKV